jgi:hypothetical protein
MPDIAAEVARLRTEIEMLVQGLTLQQQSLALMDEKLDRLLEAATVEPVGEGADPLADALRRIIGLLATLSDGQREILDRLTPARAY